MGIKIGINPKEKILTIEEEGETNKYQFTDIWLGNKESVWIVELVDGSTLILRFGGLAILKREDK